MNPSDQLSTLWPPAYVLRKHPRARGIKLRASIKHGLEITVPSRFNLKELPSVLDLNRPWIEVQLQRLQEEVNKRQPFSFPSQIEFKALDKAWPLVLIPAETGLRLLWRPSGELVLVGPVEDKSKCKKLLINWSIRQAKLELYKQLMQISSEIGIPFASLKVRNQQSRWGSCSSKKAINLNFKCLFLRPELMRHVMIHELCHTVEMNHSERFWSLVAQFDARWKEHRKELRRSQHLLPGWLLGL